MLEDYRRAHKRAQKELQRDVAAGRYPYPPALDDILKGEGYQGEVPIGTFEIDLSLVAGTRTRGRQNTFSADFMPLPESTSEFAMKWSDLIDSQRAEGIRDPIIVYEFLQRFYVREGNKRVSVLRYLGQPKVLAQVTRVVPMTSDSKTHRIYREFERFFRVAPIYGIFFSEEGGYARLALIAGRDLDTPWPEEEVRALRQAFEAFCEAFHERGGDRLGLLTGDAFLLYVDIYGVSHVRAATAPEVAADVARIWKELVVARDGGRVVYLENPTSSKTSLTTELKNIYKGAVRAKPFRVAFIYERNPLADGWTRLHERGRIKLSERLGALISTKAYPDCADSCDFDLAVEDALDAGADLIVTIQPTQMRDALRAAVSHPEVAFINCSVSLSHSAVRTFSGRLFEVKFLLGAAAAAMAENHLVGYVAESPVFGTVAEINAFALGARLVDSHATVHLKWFSAKDYDWKRELAEEGVRVVSARDFEDPALPDAAWGLYRVNEDGSTTHLANPIWKWGRYYELIVRSIRSETWYREGNRLRGEALNYWWGMSAGIVDVELSDMLPEAQRALVEVLRQPIMSGRLDPFAGVLRDQAGTVVSDGSGRLASDEIVRMRWLNENIVGRLPEQCELSEDGLEHVEVSGVIPLDPEKLPRRGLVR